MKIRIGEDDNSIDIEGLTIEEANMILALAGHSSGSLQSFHARLYDILEERGWLEAYVVDPILYIKKETSI